MRSGLQRSAAAGVVAVAAVAAGFVAVVPGVAAVAARVAVAADCFDGAAPEPSAPSSQCGNSRLPLSSKPASQEEVLPAAFQLAAATSTASSAAQLVRTWVSPRT